MAGKKPEDTIPGGNDDTIPGGNADEPTTPMTVNTDALNPMVVQAVDFTNATMTNAISAEANGIAYQKVAQATAFAIQDATDYLRNIMAMAGAAQGVALEKMIKAAAMTPPDEPHMKAYQTVLSTAQQTITAAEAVLSTTGTNAANVANGFPKA